MDGHDTRWPLRPRGRRGTLNARSPTISCGESGVGCRGLTRALFAPAAVEVDQPFPQKAVFTAKRHMVRVSRCSWGTGHLRLMSWGFGLACCGLALWPSCYTCCVHELGDPRLGAGRAGGVGE